MNIPTNIGKSTILATCIFWTINLTHEGDLDFAPIIILSLIPICICVTLTILITICPIFWAFKKENDSNITLVKKLFPYYAIVAFSLCVFGATASNYDFYFVSFFIAAYLTTAQSWIWFAKEK